MAAEAEKTPDDFCEGDMGMKTFWSIFWRMLLATAAWWYLLYLMLSLMAIAFMFGGGFSVDTLICFFCFPPAALLLYLLWKKCATPMPFRIAAAVMLFLCAAPGLPWLVYVPELRDFNARTHSHIEKTVESPESLFIQDDIMLKDYKPGSSARNPHLPLDYSKRRPTLWAKVWDQSSMPSEEYHMYAVRKYLDGARIKALALNDASGAVHLYRSKGGPPVASIKVAQGTRKAAETFGNAEAFLTSLVMESFDLQEYRAETFGNAEAFLTASPPCYRAHIQEKERRFLGRMPLYRIQRMDIYDNRSGERIAWAENLQKYAGWFGPWKLVEGPGVQDFQLFLDQVFPGLSEQKRNKASGRQTPEAAAP